MQQNNSPMPHQYDDEIDLFELFQTLWQQKWLILSTTLIAPVLAYVFTVLMPYKSDYYQGSATIELATIQVNSEASNQVVQVIEPLNDLAQLVPNLTSVSATAPRGASKVLEMSTTGASKEQVAEKLNKAIQVIEQRHQKMLANLKEVQVISATEQVGQNSIVLKSPKDKLKLILAVAIVLGGMLGVFIALIRSAIQKRKAQTA
jgi:capsular polysaccharide biosynthesis protein